MRESLYAFAFIFCCIAAWFFYAGFTLDTTVSAGADTASGFQEVANLQLMEIQILDVAIGIGSAIVTSICYAAGAIVGALDCEGAPSER